MANERNQLVKLNISDVVYTKSKIKENDYQLIEKLKMSIQAQGQLKSILVCEGDLNKYQCIEGSKILFCLIELGYEYVYAINIGKLTETEKDIIRLQVMKDYFLVDYSMVGLMLRDISSQTPINKLSNIIPFDARQVENLINLTNFDWETFNLNKQTEGQMSLFGFNDTIPNQIEYEEPQIEIKQIEEKKEVEKIDNEVKESISFEKNMSTLSENIIEETKIIESKQETVQPTSSDEVKHEYAHIVYYEDGQYKMMPERQYFDIDKKHEQLYRNTFSNCRLFIANKNNQQQTLI
jgi:hypothetical protein